MRLVLHALCILWTVVMFSGPTICPAGAADHPRLVVIVSVDQLAQDYLIRFADNFAEDGIFRRVSHGGASYRHCHHRHAFTYTAPGHAVLLTGTYPSVHGIIANEWFDRDQKEMRYCVKDSQVKVIGTTSDKGMSPRSLLVNTAGDQLKLATVGKAKVFGVAIKERAAILMAGHSADAAFWLDHDCWVTTDYYRQDLPGYLRGLNAAGAMDRQYRGQTWDLLLPKGRYRNSGPDENTWENPPSGFRAAFPHSLLKPGQGTAKDFGEQVLNSPYGNDYTLQAAREIVRHEGLGTHDVPDILCVSLSSNDYVGHAFGPHSLEVEDLTYRTDAALGAFARFVDEQVGVGRWTLILTADHGIAPIVGYAQQSRLRLPAVYDPLPVQKVRKELEAELRRQLGVPADAAALIQEVEEFQLYLNLQHPALAGTQLPRARQIARDWLARQPHVSIARSQEDLLSADGDELHRALRRTFHPQRSGDVLWALAPYCIPGDKKRPGDQRGTTHGSPWQYDTHVPLLLLGAGIRPGQFDRLVSPASIASTVARLLRVDAPAANVELPLNESLSLEAD